MRRKLRKRLLRYWRNLYYHRIKKDTYSYHGLEVGLPLSVPYQLRRLVIDGKYEQDERRAIERHMPADLPVIELGGSLGIISRFIASRLADTTAHVVVEANPDLVAICEANARRAARSGPVTLVHKALSYDGPRVAFLASDDFLSNRIASGSPGHAVEVETCALPELVALAGAEDGYCLIADIEGAEFDLFRHDREALAGCRIAIVEIHPAIFEDDDRTEAEFWELVSAAGMRQVERTANVCVLKRE